MAWEDIPKKVQIANDKFPPKEGYHTVCFAVAMDGACGGDLPQKIYDLNAKQGVTLGFARELLQKDTEYGAKFLTPQQRKLPSIRRSLVRGAREMVRNIQDGEISLIFATHVNGSGHATSLVPGPGNSILKFDLNSPGISKRIRRPQAVKMIKRVWRKGSVFKMEY